MTVRQLVSRLGFVCICLILRMNCLAAEPFVAKASPSNLDRYNDSLANAISNVNVERYADAFAEFCKIVAESPHDVRLLQLTGYAALRSGSPHEAEKYFELALAEVPANPWPLRVALINAYAAESRWNDFDTLRDRLRRAKIAGDPLLVNSGGYVVENFQAYGTHLEAVEYPSFAGASHIRYRFRAFREDRATDPDAARRIADEVRFDLESSEKGIDSSTSDSRTPAPPLSHNKTFRLESYPAADGSHQTVATFGSIEPSYETVRSYVLAQMYLTKAQ